MAARRRKRRSRRTTVRGNTKVFYTRSGKKVTIPMRSARMRGRARRRSSWNRVFGTAARRCLRKRGVRPFTKRFGQCMKSELRGKGRRKRRSRR